MRKVVNEAVDVLINVPPDKVDEVLGKIKEGLVGKHKVYTAEELLAMANEQVACLRQRLGELVAKGKVTQEQIDAIVTCLESKREAAIAKVANVPIIGTHLPILAAISKDFLTASVQMLMAKYIGNDGTNYLTDDEITDEVELPEGIAWWLTDVEDGQQFCTDKTTPEDEKTIIEDQGRLRVIATGAIALDIHTDVLARHNVDATGSRFKDAGKVPNLCRGGGEPRLYYSSVDHVSAKWGSASCSSYI